MSSSRRWLLLLALFVALSFVASPAAAQEEPDCPTCPTWSFLIWPDSTLTSVRRVDTTITTDRLFISNTGNQPDDYILSCQTTSHLTCTITSGTYISLAAAQADTIEVTYTTVGTGTGVLTVSGISEMTHNTENGKLYVPVVSYGVAVTPDNGTTPMRSANTSGHTESFTITNAGSASNTFAIACGGSGGVTCTGTSTGSVALAGGANTQVTATYSVGSPGTGQLTLTATGTNAADGGSYNVPIQLAAPLVTLVVPSGTGRAVVHNRQPVIRALLKPNGSGMVDTTLTVLKWRGQTVTHLARHNRGVIEWEVDSTRWLTTATGATDSALVEVTACTVATTACTTVTRWVVLEDDQKPVLGFTGMPLGTPHGGFGAPFGPGLGVSGAEVETGFSIPSYVSMGVARSAGLVYSTRQSYPRALVQVDLELLWPAGTPNQIKLVLSEAGTGLDSMTLTSPTCATGAVRRCRAALQADFSATSFSAPTRKWLTIEARVTSGAVTRIAADSVEVVVVDRRTTPYGSGWWPAGVSQVVAAGHDRVVVGAAGTATIYRGHGDSVYVPPPGRFTALVKTGGGWELRPRGSLAKALFDANGRLKATVDRNGNADSVRYDGGGKVTGFRDPIGKVISLAYDGNGKLSTFTDPGGRQSRVTIAVGDNRLTYDSVASPTGRPAVVRYEYHAEGAAPYSNVIARRLGVLGDTTAPTYSATPRTRPISVTLPRVQDETGSNVTPVIAYKAYELQGLGSLVSLDSVYVEMKDPRNHWTRSLLNRWAQSRRSWDSLGLLSRAAYDPDGFVLWAEGKNGDSSRVYSAYDAARRLLKTYITRSSTDTLRLDSLVYDGNHRVTERIDSRGKKSRAVYDGRGNVIQTISPNNDATYTWYRSDGLVDSTRHDGHVAGTGYRYEGTWVNLHRVIDPAGDTVTTNTYDGYGRPTRADARAEIRLSGSTLWYRWQRTESFLNEANQTDSARTMYSDSSSSIGFTPTWPAASDTVKTTRVAWRFDRAGRDSLRLNNRGKATLYLYDRLGRLVSRRPWTDSTAVKDSMVYDVAGNLKAAITRRGHTITTSYDSRNRDTLSVIPTVGTLRKRYTGPQDQLNRMWYDSPIDSIGGVNGEVRRGYDQRGRLVADTMYTGNTARVATYTYDAHERPLTTTDALGTWTIGYEPTRGYADTLKTPLGDTLVYVHDEHGRAVGPSVYSDGLRHGYNVTWKPNETLSSVSATTQAAGGAYVSGRYARPSSQDDSYLALNPVWVEQRSAAGAIDSLKATVDHDGWGRLKGWTDLKNGSTVKTETYTFDRAGNVNTPSGGEVHDAVTDRLLERSEGGAATRSYQYDRAGNQTHNIVPWATRTYQYDALNRLVSVRKGTTLIARYAYDVLGRRIAKHVYNTDNGGTIAYTRFIYQGNHVGYETDSAGTVGFRYVWGLGTDELVAFRDPAGTHYYAVTDRLGSIRTVVKRDGTWVMCQRFTPYGELLARDSIGAATPKLRYGWTGRELDEESSFHYLRSRYYSNVTRRFNQEDKIGYAGGGNLYGYVGGAPLEATDPYGAQKDWQHRQAEKEGAQQTRRQSGGGMAGSGGFLVATGADAVFGLPDRFAAAMAASEVNLLKSPTPSAPKADTVEVRGDRLKAAMEAKRASDPRYRAMHDQLHASPNKYVFISSELEPDAGENSPEFTGFATDNNPVTSPFGPVLSDAYQKYWPEGATAGVMIGVNARYLDDVIGHETAHLMGVEEIGRIYRHADDTPLWKTFPIPRR